MKQNFMLRKSNRLVCNPLFLYAVSWSIVISLYLLEWSYKYPPLSLELFLFLFSTCVISFVLAIVTHKNKRFEYKAIINPDRYYKWIIKQTKRVYFLLIIEFIYFKTIPFLSYLSGNAETSLYQEFAMPFVHVIVVNGLLLLFYFSSYCFFSSGENRYHFLKPMFVNLIGPLLFMSRGSLLHMIFGLFLLYLMSGRKALKILALIIPLSFVVLFLFGVAGNLRINNPEGKLILQWGGASEKFEESFVPKEYFWSYLYITSPLGNLQNAVKKKKKFNSDYNGPIPLVVNEICPMFISKRIGMPEPTNRDIYFVDPTLVVGSTFFDPYLILGWSGMTLIFCTILFYVLVMSQIIPKDCAFRVPMYVILTILTFFSLFDNMLVYMGLFPQLVFIYLLRNKK